MIDANVRTAGNQTYAGFEDVVGHLALPAEGESVTVCIEETALKAPAIVTRVSHEDQIIYLDVRWSSFAEAPVESVVTWPSVATGGSSGQVQVRARQSWVAATKTATPADSASLTVRQLSIA